MNGFKANRAVVAYWGKFLLLTSLLILVGCGEDSSAEQRLKQSIAAMKSAVDEGRISDFADYISADYNDASGRNKKYIRRLLTVYLLGRRSLFNYHIIKSIDWPTENTAQVDALVALANKPIDAGNLQNLRGNIFRFSVRFVADGQRFVVTHADWQRANIADLTSLLAS